jgi:hypothetical protein
MLAQETVQEINNGDIFGALYAGFSLVLLVVGIIAVVKFFQLAGDVRSILQLLLAEAGARDADNR